MKVDVDQEALVAELLVECMQMSVPRKSRRARRKAVNVAGCVTKTQRDGCVIYHVPAAVWRKGT